MFKTRMITSTLMLVLFLSCSKEKLPENYIARVGNSFLTSKDMPEFDISTPQNLKNYVSNWIVDEVLYKEAVKYHFDKDETIEKKVQDYKKQLVIDEFIKFFVNSRVKTSDEEIRNYYLSHRKLFTRHRDEAKVVHIVVKSFEEAKRIKTVFLSNNINELEKLHRKYRFETKVITKGQPIAELDKTIFETPVRKVLGPIATDYGYHVIKILEIKRKGTIKPLDEVRDEIIHRLTQLKIQKAYETLVDSLLSKYKYEIKTEVVK